MNGNDSTKRDPLAASPEAASSGDAGAVSRQDPAPRQAAAVPGARSKMILSVVIAACLCVLVAALVNLPPGSGVQAQDGAGVTGGPVVVDPGATTVSGVERIIEENGLEAASPVDPAKARAVEDADSAAQSNEMLSILVIEIREEIEQKETNLSEMREMLKLLNESGDDPERINTYEKLIAKTEKELEDLGRNLDRYEKAKNGDVD